MRGVPTRPRTPLRVKIVTSYTESGVLETQGGQWPSLDARSRLAPSVAGFGLLRQVVDANRLGFGKRLRGRDGDE